MLTPATHEAINNLMIAFAVFLAGGLSGLGVLLKAYVDRRAKKMKTDDDQAVAEREQARQTELEKMRKETAVAQQQAEEAKLEATQAKAITENLTNLTSTMLQFMQTYTTEQHANRNVLTNLAQSVGDGEQRISEFAEVLVENTKKSTRGIQVIEALDRRLLLIFPTENSLDEQLERMKADILKAIQDICKGQSPTPTDGGAVITPLADEPDELPKAV